MYGCNGRDYKEWAEICWVISDTEESRLYFWVKLLADIGTYEGGHTRPDPLKADAFRVELVDCTSEKSMGWGPEYKSNIVFSMDDVFKWIRDHPILSEFFFTKKEKKNLKLDFYVDRNKKAVKSKRKVI